MIKPTKGPDIPIGEDATSRELAHALGGEHRCCTPAEAEAFFCAGLAPQSLSYRVMAAAAGGDARGLETLLARGDVLPDFANGNGISPLMAAAVRGQAEAVSLLAAHPLVNLRRQNPDGWTALHFAAWAREAESLRRLLRHKAPAETRTERGATAFDLASPPLRAIFLADPAARRALRRFELPTAPGAEQPVHQKLPDEAPAQPQAAEEPKAAEKPEDRPVREAFFRALTGVALDANRDGPSRRHLAKKLAKLPEADFAAALAAAETAMRPLDWAVVFTAAAAENNTPVMRLLHDRFLFDNRLLERAVYFALEAGDHRDAVHHLLLWGADPASRAPAGLMPTGKTLRNRAFELRRAGCCEEMVLWAKAPCSEKEFSAYAHRAVLFGEDDATFRETQQLAIWRRAFKGLGAKKLKAAFATAAAKQDISAVMAAYAEARRDRLLRGKLELDRAAGGSAIAIALRHERYEFAQLAIADGYRLAEADGAAMTELRKHGTKKALQFAEDHLSGKMPVLRVEDTGKAQRSRLRALATPIHGMGRFGMPPC
jgi:hypothetical protein